MRTRLVGIAIDPDKRRREICAQAFREALFHHYILTDIFVDDAEATVFIVASLSSSGHVVALEYVSRYRVSHPEGLIIAVSEATMTVGEQFLAAGADAVLGKKEYSRSSLLALLPS